ncbi:MAG: hypothetical protein ACLP3C_33440 [Mycobacterium sp.]|uniref:hypothetical protein n=1 Tax=Mycobacterium sp. TaxID=1785 RepID=UPI003F954636
MTKRSGRYLKFEIVPAVSRAPPTSATPWARRPYESLARKGETMITAAMATYAYDQIDQARAELEQRADSMGNTKDRG